MLLYHTCALSCHHHSADVRTQERRAKNSSDCCVAPRGCADSRSPPPSLLAEAAHIEGHVESSPVPARLWKILESILILRESLGPLVGAALVHYSWPCGLGGPLELFTFEVVLRELEGGAHAWVLAPLLSVGVRLQSQEGPREAACSGPCPL